MASSSGSNNVGMVAATAGSATATAALFCASVVSGIYLSKQQQNNRFSSLTSTTNKNAKEATSWNALQEDTPSGSTTTVDIDVEVNRILTPGSITIAYASTTGTCLNMAHDLHTKLVTTLADIYPSENKADHDDNHNSNFNNKYSVQIQPIHNFDWWDEFLNNENSNNNHKNGSSFPLASPPILILILPTWTGGTLPPPVKDNRLLQAAFPNIVESLQEITTDWRVPKRALAPTNLTVSVFGLGSSEYDASTFCKPAKDVHRMLVHKLGAKRLLEKSVVNAHSNGKKRNWNLSLGDDSKSGNGEETLFQDWTAMVTHGVVKKLHAVHGTKTDKQGCGCGQGEKEKEQQGDTCCQSSGDTNAARHKHKKHTKGKGGNPQADSASDNSDDNHEETDDDDDDDDYPSSEEEEDDDESINSSSSNNNEPDVVDMEDMGNTINKMKNKKTATKKAVNEPFPEMVTKKQAVALKKEGYKLIGTHSAVKLCRWTKHQLRGRGGCYKHTFYGITSYQCMESTPSLACANKCVFCWRHHKNPVGTSWKWKTDDPYMIVAESIAMHVKMIRETKGIPGVLPSRWNEALNVKHCALSLVGEPIMYPRIDEFLGELHKRDISTFLVTNGQHPDAIANLRPLTQLYVSVDAPTPESLDAIDRPLFKDAWERLRRSLRCLRDKGQRTVARLTVVKGWNSDEIGGYAELIALGKCSLVEVKGVTFCGKSDASNLNMSNTPWHHEVVELTMKLQKELARLTEIGGPDAPPLYGLACEHRHSVSALLARVDQFAYVDEETGERKWRTWIDYDKFQILAEKARLDPTFRFGVTDYTADTPDWALPGAEEEGFDPTDTRHFRNKRLYTKFDSKGVPTHDKDGNPLAAEEITRLQGLMEQKRKDTSSSTGDVIVKQGRGGEKDVQDISLMFRHLVVDKK